MVISLKQLLNNIDFLHEHDRDEVENYWEILA